MKSFWLLLLVSSGSFAQPELTHDTIQVNQLLLLSRKDQWIDSYRSLNYADQALKLSREINFSHGIAVAQNLRGFCFWSFGDNDLAIESALEALDIARRDHDVQARGSRAAGAAAHDPARLLRQSPAATNAAQKN